jgi:hypothetical protein
MVHRSMEDDSRVADELYIKRVLLVLEDFHFFSLYSFSCIAKHVMTLKELRLLSCLDSLKTNFKPFVLFSRYHICVTNITYARPRPLQRYKVMFASLYGQNRFWYPPCHLMKMSANRASTMLGHASWEITPPIDCSKS